MKEKNVTPFLKMTLRFVSGSFFLTLLNVPSFSASAQTQLSLEDGLDYKIGQAIFEKIWVSSPSSTTASDGLGPFYNARSCSQCHNDGGRGVIDKALVIQLNDNNYGQQFQTFAVPGLAAEAKVNLEYSEEIIELSNTTSVTMHHPQYSFQNLNFGTLSSINYSPRLASSLAGLGEIELIPEQQLIALADVQDNDNNGISGRLNKVWDEVQQKQSIGRFGWKAGQATLLQQSAKALNLDIGISSYLYPDPYGDCTAIQSLCTDAPNGNSAIHDDLEASKVMLDSLLFFVQNIPAPVQNAEVNNESAGEALFKGAGCESCHHSQFDLGDRQIKPYSDFLLHDMGEALADDFEEGLASGSEWRTAPLWGLSRAVEAQYLHDGRAKSLLEAIFWHGGEAQGAVARVRAMTKAEREDLIRFLDRL